MGDFTPYTTEDLARIERDQHDLLWVAWAAPEKMDFAMQELKATVPYLSATPVGAPALDRIESFILETFSTADEFDLPENQQLADRLTRGIGEIFRQREGRWFNVPDWGGARYPHFGPVIRDEWLPAYMDVAHLATAAIHHRTGNYMSGIFTGNEDVYTAWVAAGRPPMAEWEAMYDW